MTVYNGEKFLREAIDSILGQTFSDFEFIIVDDGSTDNSRDIIRSYTDPRIRVIENERNLGVSASRNKGMKMSRGKYIALMDADDISLADRFYKQYCFMEENPDVDVLGGRIEYFGGRSTVSSPPISHDEIMTSLLFRTSLHVISAFIRKTALLRFNEFYDTRYNISEDGEYWIRLSLKGATFANMNDVLVRYRWHKNNTSTRYRKEQIEISSRIRAHYLNHLGINNTEEHLHTFYLLKKRTRLSKKQIEDLRALFIEIHAANATMHFFPVSALEKQLSRKWFETLYLSTHNGLWAWLTYHKEPMLKHHRAGLPAHAKFFVKCCLSR